MLADHGLDSVRKARRGFGEALTFEVKSFIEEYGAQAEVDRQWGNPEVFRG